MTLFIVRVGKIDRRQLPELERLYQEHKLTNMAVVLNGRKKAVAAMVMVTVMDRVMVIRMRKRRRDYLDGRKRNPGNNAIISL